MRPGRRPKSSVVSEPVPSQPGDQSARPWRDSWVERQRARLNTEALDHSLDPQSSGRGAHPTDTERTQAACAAWGAGGYKEAQPCCERARAQQHWHRFPHVKCTPMSAPGPSGERQEHLDAIIAFAGAGLRRRRFRVQDTLTVKWATGDLPEE